VPAPAPAPAPEEHGAGPHEDAHGICHIGQTIVLLRPGIDPDEAAAALAARYKGVVCRIYRRSVRGVTLRCTGPAVVRALAADPLVLSTEPDVVVRAGPNPMRPGALGPIISSAKAAGAQVVPEGLRRMGFAAVTRGRAAEASLARVGVAIVDTGIDRAHPDLAVAVAGAVSFVEGVESPHDGNGHGTHCAGTVAARDDAQGVVGVAPGVRLYAVKVLDDEGAGALSDVIAGLEWVAAHADEIAVANLSLGVTGQSPSLRAAIQACVRAGVVVVAAAGNDGADVFGEDGAFGTADDRIPAAFPEVCAVSALADSDGLSGGAGASTKAGADDALATFTCRAAKMHASALVRSAGGAIDVAAPGVDILSTWPGGGLRRSSGTSMAAPHVAGLAARLTAIRGRDWNRDGRTDEADVYAIRQAIVESAEGQSRWRTDGATGDQDGRPEGLARLPGTGAAEEIASAAPPSAPRPPRASPAPAPPTTPSRPASPPPAAARPASPPPAAARPASSPTTPTAPPAPRPARAAARSIPVVLLGDADLPAPPRALAVPGVEVVAIVPASDQGPGARESVLVGLRNLSARDAAGFEVLLLDHASGTGLGRFPISSLEAGGHRTIVFPFDAGRLDGSVHLRAVVVRARR